MKIRTDCNQGFSVKKEKLFSPKVFQTSAPTFSLMQSTVAALHASQWLKKTVVQKLESCQLSGDIEYFVCGFNFLTVFESAGEIWCRNGKLSSSLFYLRNKFLFTEVAAILCSTYVWCKFQEHLGAIVYFHSERIYYWLLK